MKLIRRTVKFLAALCRAGRFACVTSSGECKDRVLGFTSAVWSARNSPGESFHGRVSRLRKCFRCPIFDRKRLTCGTPGDVEKTYTGEDGSQRPMGCFCYMPVKVALADAVCWFDQHTGKGSWGWTA
jgi:hypothetical protein